MSAFAVVLIGDASEPAWERIEGDLVGRTQALRRAGEQFQVLRHNQLGDLAPGARAAAVVLCHGQNITHAETTAIEACQNSKFPMFPVVRDLTSFVALAPEVVAYLNGYELADAQDTGEFVGLVLEALGLQRAKRKIFISYARVDSSDIAWQLREAFAKRWYSVFLDTISIRPGAAFQDELLQELADSDVMVLLNSPNVGNRPYVQKEIAFADQAGVGGVQITWPGIKPLREGAFFEPIKLDDRLAKSRDGRPTLLTDTGLTEIVRTVASLRTALQEQREMRLVRPIEAYAQAKRWQALFHPGRYIELRSGSGAPIRLDLALGAPTSRDLEGAIVNAASSPGRLVYDPLGITDEAAKHLEFLRERLDLEYLDPKDTLRWTVIP
jgi:hypothetical protein